MQYISMQRLFLVFTVWFIHTYDGASKAARAETLYRKVKTRVTLECPQLLPSESFGGVTWKHDGDLLATTSLSKRTEINDKDLKDKVSILDVGMTLVIKSVSAEVSGIFNCTVDFYKDGNTSNVSSRANGHILVILDVPDRLKKPKILEVTSDQAKVSWEPGDSNNSPIESFEINVQECNEQSPMRTERVQSSSAREATIRGLQPYTCYTMAVSARNDVGLSNPSSKSDSFYTEQTVPEAVPTNFHVNATRHELDLSWEKPKNNLNGKMLGYKIRYGTGKSSMTTELEDPDQTEAKIEGLMPYTMYAVSIQIYNSAGDGPQTSMMVQTLEGVPSIPRITHISKRTDTSFYVHWEPPEKPYGKLISYTIQWNHRDTKKSREIAGHLTNPMAAYISELKPYTGYEVQVAASTKGGLGEFTEGFPALTDVAAPSVPRNLNLTKLSRTSVHLKWERPAVIYKKVDYYVIKMWDHRGDDHTEYIHGGLEQHTMTSLIEDSQYHLKIAGTTRAIFSNQSFVGDFTQILVFSIGEIIPRPASEDDDDSLSPVVIAVIVCVILIIIIVVVLFVGYRFYNCRRCYEAAFLYLAVPSNGHTAPQTNIIVEEPSEEKQYPDIPVNDFISHVELMHMDSDIAFAQEFDEINRASTTDKYGFENSNAPDNRMKNRYINIVAYDHSRVVLKSDMGRPRQSDYINANYVDGYKKPRAYIATQGPLPSTFPDFWRMVWEQNTSVIVMITNLMEKGRRKCDQYWPNDGGETYGNILVKLTYTVPRAHYTVRIFTLKNLKRHSMKGANERTVYHYHYTEWPDHGVPDYSLPVLDFVQKSAADSGPDSGPIVVHCSAGVGRTGTYILIDSMIAQIQDKRSINIPGFTQFIRRQRNYLVQTEDQYIFIHSVLVEYILGGGATEVREEQMSEYLSQLELPPYDQTLSVTETSLLTKQFQLITRFQPTEADLYASQRPCNLEKNREGSLLPVNLKRVLLPARPGVEGSDYINASYLQGYERSGEFVVTQHPTDDTIEDFWRMVWDRNSTVIMVLSAVDGEEYKEFWPPKDSSIEVDAGNFRLAMKDGPIVDEEQGSTIYEFILDSIQYDYTLMTRIICVNDWPTSCVELHKAFDVIVTAHDYVSAMECGPIVVMDRFGGAAACTFCALWTLRDQLLSEKCADFYQLAKLYHYKRPGMLATEEDYFFLHKAMAALCRHISDNPSITSNSNHQSRYHHHHHANNHIHNHNSSAPPPPPPPQQNGTLPRANSTPHNPPTSGAIPRSNTINGSVTNNDTAVVIMDPATTNDSAAAKAQEAEDEAQREATSMNDMSDSRHSYMLDSGEEAKLETNI